MDKCEQTRNQPGNIDVTNRQVNRGRVDLLVLRYMAQKVRIMLHGPDRPLNAAIPTFYSLEERKRRTHRIAIYDSQTLLQDTDLSFVGFVSGRRQGLDPFIVEELERADRVMLTELAHVPGLLSYSSMELRTRTWYNLVLMSSLDAKSHLKSVEMHRYASYQLAPHYYEWIRLHNGSMVGGLASHALHLRNTKYYTFPNIGQRPTVRELVY